MTISNPNNYPGANATVVAYAASDPRVPAFDKTGESGMLEVPLPVNEGYKDATGEFKQTGTTWYSYLAKADYIPPIKKGDKVRVEDARQEVRTYTNRDGVETVGITLRFGTITVLDGGPTKGQAPF